MTRIAPYLAFALLGLTGCNTDSVQNASAQTLPRTLRRDSDLQPAGGPQQTYELRRVWSGAYFNFYFNEPSPDGRYISEINYPTGDLAVRDLMTGELVLVTHHGADGDRGLSYGSVFSPDGKRLAYHWIGDNRGEAAIELRTVGLDGSDERVLVGVRPDIGGIYPTDWSADGRHILAWVTRPDNTVQLTLIAVADGSMQVLKSLGWQFPSEALLSPDGRYVAYSIGEGSSEADADPPELRILAVDGSQEVEVAPHPAEQSMLGWTPDGGAVLFYRYDGTSGSIWQIAIEDGGPVGKAILIESDVRVSSIGFSRDAYFFGTRVESAQVHTAMIDPSGGGFLADPRPVGDQGSSRTDHGAWSVDGSQLAYVGQEPSGLMLVVRAVDGGEERAIPLSPLWWIGEVVWAPDGESVLVVGVASGRSYVGRAVYRIDLTSGDATLVLAERLELGAGLAVAPDGQALYVGTGRDGIVRYDLSSGEETQLYADSLTPNNYQIALSPDGQMIAFSGRVSGRVPSAGSESRILVIRTDGRGEAREVFRTEAPQHLGLERRSSIIAWTPDGRGVLFVRGSQSEPHVLSRISIDGGPVTDIVEFPCDGGDCTVMQLEIHPDGRRIALSVGKPIGEIWMMTGFGVGDAASGTSQSR